MTDLRGTYTPDSESDYTGNTVFKIVAAIIVLLGLGAVGAYYLGTDMLQQQPTRLALAPSIPIKPVIAPRMATPAPMTTQSSIAPSAAQPAPDAASVAPPHARRHVAQQSADLQPRPAPLEAPTPPTSTEPTGVTPTPPAVDASAPAQDPAPAQPATQP